MSETIFGIRAVPKGLILQSLDLATGQVQEQSDLVRELTLQPHERLTSFSCLPDGTFTLSTTSFSPETKTIANRLTSLEQSPKSEAVSDLEPDSTVESLVVTSKGETITIVSQNGGTPPLRLATIDRQTIRAIVAPEFVLPPEQRVSNLIQCPNGAIYVTILGRESSTQLGQLDLQERKLIPLPQLRFHDKPLLNDLKSLACSPNGQLYALADPEYQGENSLLTVDVSTGAMSFVREFAVDKIAFARP